MPVLKLKPGVNVCGIRPEIILAIEIVKSVYFAFDFDCIVTSLNDSRHAKTSRHYQGMAVDFRIWHVENIHPIFDAIKDSLTDDYFALLESDHIHVSYKPQRIS